MTSIHRQYRMHSTYIESKNVGVSVTNDMSSRRRRVEVTIKSNGKLSNVTHC